MTRQLTLFALLGLALLLTACQGGTRVIKDGFTAFKDPLGFVR